MLVTCVSANLWGTWRQGQPLSPLFWSCWRRGRWHHRWIWRKPRCPGWSRSLCLRTDRRERPGRWSERCPALGGAPAETCSSPQSARSDSPRLQPKTPVHGEGKTECNYTGRNTIKIYYDVMKHTLSWHWMTRAQFSQISPHTGMTGDDVDLLFLGTSPETPSSPSRLWPRRSKNPQVSSASPAESAGGTNTPHRLSCSAAPLTSSLSGWRTWQGSPLRPPSWRGKNEPWSGWGLLPKEFRADRRKKLGKDRQSYGPLVPSK